MIELPSSFAGHWFDGRHAQAHAVSFSVSRGELVLARENAPHERHRLAAVRISEPLGQAPRLFDLPDGSVLQARETPALAAALSAAGHREPWVVGWQSAWPASLIALLLLIAGSIWLYVEGLPRAADWAAGLLSPELEARMGDQVLVALDHGMLVPSALTPQQQAGIAARLAAFESASGLEATRRLEFRTVASGEGTNAFSLPGGTIVLLDGLVKLSAEDPEMLLAVLAHEAGHQARHHMTRSLFRALGGAALAGLLWGDYSSVASHAALLFGQLGYSRDDEVEADDFAIAALRRAGISPAAFARFFTAMEAKTPGRRREVPGWLSTHPDSGSRVERARAAAEADATAASAASR